MRTAEEIAKEHILEHNHESHVAYNGAIKDAVEAMKSYAREALEEAAKQAKTKELYEGEGRDSFYAGTVVDKESITGIELK